MALQVVACKSGTRFDLKIAFAFIVRALPTDHTFLVRRDGNAMNTIKAGNMGKRHSTLLRKESYLTTPKKPSEKDTTPAKFSMSPMGSGYQRVIVIRAVGPV
jgi:hypothetical protein